MNKICECCGKEYKGRPKRKYCSNECYRLFEKKQKKPHDKICKFCGKGLNDKQAWQKQNYCSAKCFGLDHRGENNSIHKLEIHPMKRKHLTEETKIKLSIAHKGKSLSEEHKRKLSENSPRSFLGKHHTDETKRKISEANKGVCAGEKNPMYGKTHTEEVKRKLSKARKGKTHTEESKRKMSESHKGRTVTNETRKKLSVALTGRKFSKEHRKNLRLARLKEIKEKNGTIFPNYNKEACEWFKLFDEANNTNGQYATSGGEFYIEDLGYWLDYINFDMKLIIEWDEEKHKYKKEKDANRQEEIQDLYKEFKFIRIKEDAIPLKFCL